MRALSCVTLLSACAALSACLATSPSSSSGADAPTARQDEPRPRVAPVAGTAPAREPQLAGNRPIEMPAPSAGPPPPLGAASEVKIGAKKVHLASVELDKRCKRMVAPFDMTSNFLELVSLTMKRTSEGVSTYLDEKFNGKKASAKDAKAKTKHQISASIRQAAVQMNWLPMPMEVMYGGMLHDKMKAEILERDSRVGKKVYPAAEALMADVLAGLGEPHEYQFQLFVRTAAGENAMAIPGGYVYVDKALVEDPALRDKAYFALAHELSHVLQRDQTRALQARLIDAVSLKGGVDDMIKMMRSAKDRDKTIFTGLLAGKLLFEKHFTEQELHADACGVRLLDRSFSDEQRLVKSLQAFVDRLPPPEAPKAAPGQAAAPAAGSNGLASKATAGLQPALAKTDNLVELVTRPIEQHPNTNERVERLREMVKIVRAEAAQ